MTYKQIEDVVKAKDWEFLIKHYLPLNVVEHHSFKESMLIVGHLVIQAMDVRTEEITEFLSDFAINVMIILRAEHPKEWFADWKNDAFLGAKCMSVFRHAEAFLYVKNAFLSLEDPPTSLIYAYIAAGRHCPSPYLSDEEEEELSLKAIKKEITYEWALKMAKIAYFKGDKTMDQYWEKQAEELERKNIHTAAIVPNAIKELSNIKNMEK